jgi:hypothetical protein
MTDPTRAECTKEALLEYIRECYAGAQAPDLKILCEKYDITTVQPVDMLPHTMHVENIVRLMRKVKEFTVDGSQFTVPSILKSE